LATLTVKLCEVFSTESGRAFLIWDGNGPGRAFGRRIIEIHNYTYVYYHQNKEDRNHKRSNSPGWPSNGKLKYQLLENFRSSLSQQEYVTHSAQTVNECECYVYDGNGGVKHVKSDTDDASANKENHGDMAMAEALCCHALSEKPKPKAKKVVAPIGSAEYRYRQMDQMRQLEQDDTWY
jgi:hypothetical protein